MFLPTTQTECDALGWDRLDVILVTGDSYIDSPFMGIAVIGRVLQQAGYRVGVIAQPEIDSDRDIGRLGEPELFWGVSGGSVDSMVANFTALKKRRKSDDFTPGGLNTRRPDRAVIAYANLIRRFFKNTVPIVLGGIEASLRRISHFDYWSDRVRRSILFDAKADLLVYGMGENTVVALARRLADKAPVTDLAGLCYPAAEPVSGYAMLPSHQEVATDKGAFERMFAAFYTNCDPVFGQGLCQRQDTRYLVQTPPALPLSTQALDAVYALPFTHDQHPLHERLGPVRALETIRFSIATHRGCYGECRFCAIAIHQGRAVQSRSEASIYAEAQRMTHHRQFKGIIRDVGGPTANMYGIDCDRKVKKGSCTQRGCLFPRICPQLPVDHSPQIRLLEKLRAIKGIRKVFVASGLRYDMILADEKSGDRYLANLVAHHVSGQLKIAPEHTQSHVLSAMGKPDPADLLSFKARFDQMTRQAGKDQYLTYYFIAAHPGCNPGDMAALSQYCSRHLKTTPRQIQVFTPTPSTWSTLMYWTGKDPFTGQPIFVERDLRRKSDQKAAVVRPSRPKGKSGSKLAGNSKIGKDRK
ncbi:MAG: YgiQ family radical SAM protein [Desulfobacterales bacterium]|nr:YgiQ family radical SAM protein [Desulfobacterales bacterium]